MKVIRANKAPMLNKAGSETIRAKSNFRMPLAALMRRRMRPKKGGKMKNGLSDVNHPRYFTSGLFLRMVPKKGALLKKYLLNVAYI